MLVLVLKEFILRQMNFPEDFCKKAGTYCFTGMNGNNRRPAVGVLQKQMASPLPLSNKTDILQDRGNISFDKRRGRAQGVSL